MHVKYFAVFVFSVCFEYVSCIRCYECNSHNNSMCLDPTLYDADTLTAFLPLANCGQNVIAAGNTQFFCRKIVQTILHKGYEPDVRVTRGCGWVRHHRDCYKADNEDHLETVCQCFHDDCNTATQLSYSLGVVLSIVSGLHIIVRAV